MDREYSFNNELSLLFAASLILLFIAATISLFRRILPSIMNLPVAPGAGPKDLKKLEKQLAKEEKKEGKSVKNAISELHALEKASAKSKEAVGKASHNVDKVGQKEMETQRALDKATHNHDIATTNVRGAEKELKAMQDKEKKVGVDLQAKKQQVDQLIADQKAHNSMRESKFTEVQHAKDDLAQPRTSVDPPAYPTVDRGTN
ncbi:hypothetical protein FISHEDRAFT_76158 [Fistulina hepatica ATCC 64428]|uniref:Uncharacterized protein n=1 Tax=Fistulina hepatica ATCC 64428 TaxID=1128425 RepID=A0A0D7A532_9AGAR|nr:hypothetical protein FISHEDRAFT_76158 [Fistulina hepatica ATCC 64428]